MIFKEHENEKKRKYQQRVLDVEMGSFTPLVFGTNGGMGIECQMFLKQLAQKLAEKDDERYAVVIAWLRTNLFHRVSPPPRPPNTGSGETLFGYGHVTSQILGYSVICR
jgi:hypothetical protein